MSKQLKFLQVSTLLRTYIDPEKVSHERYDELLSSDVTVQADFVRSVQAVLSGEVKIDFGVKEVTFDGKVFKPPAW